VTLSSNGINATLTAINSTVKGNVTLEVTYNNQKCGTASSSITVWVGKPNVTSNAINGGHDNVPVTSNSNLDVNAATGVTQYYWFIYTQSTNCGGGGGLYPPGTTMPRFVSPQMVYTTTQTSPSRFATINWGNCPGVYVVNCIAINPCGQTPIYHKIVTVYPTGGGNPDPCPPAPLQVYPNPVDEGDMTINIIVPPPPCDDLGRGIAIEPIRNEVRIYDFYGNLLFTETYKSDDIKVPALNLNRGHYVLNVFTSKGETRREVIVVK
jgi:hypothetical protein